MNTKALKKLASGWWCQSDPSSHRCAEELLALLEPEAERKHKSTETQERFYHFKPALDPLLSLDGERLFEDPAGTVFMRKHGDYWYASVALCDPRDQFCRRTGRLVARRKFFQKPKLVMQVTYQPGSTPDYADACAMIDAAANRRVTK